MYTIRKKFRFEAAHVLDTSYSKECQNIHGHSYVVEVFVSSPLLNDDGMVIDFGKLSEVVKLILKIWDHALIVRKVMTNASLLHAINGRTKIIWVDWNPTAENMAKYIHGEVKRGLALQPHRLKVRVHETETGWAEYKEESE